MIFGFVILLLGLTGGSALYINGPTRRLHQVLDFNVLEGIIRTIYIDRFNLQRLSVLLEFGGMDFSMSYATQTEPESVWQAYEELVVYPELHRFVFTMPKLLAENGRLWRALQTNNVPYKGLVEDFTLIKAPIDVKMEIFQNYIIEKLPGSLTRLDWLKSFVESLHGCDQFKLVLRQSWYALPGSFYYSLNPKPFSAVSQVYLEMLQEADTQLRTLLVMKLIHVVSANGKDKQLLSFVADIISSNDDNHILHDYNQLLQNIELPTPILEIKPVPKEHQTPEKRNYTGSNALPPRVMPVRRLLFAPSTLPLDPLGETSRRPEIDNSSSLNCLIGHTTITDDANIANMDNNQSNIPTTGHRNRVKRKLFEKEPEEQKLTAKEPEKQKPIAKPFDPASVVLRVFEHIKKSYTMHPIESTTLLMNMIINLKRRQKADESLIKTLVNWVLTEADRGHLIPAYTNDLFSVIPPTDEVLAFFSDAYRPLSRRSYEERLRVWMTSNGVFASIAYPMTNDTSIPLIIDLDTFAAKSIEFFITSATIINCSINRFIQLGTSTTPHTNLLQLIPIYWEQLLSAGMLLRRDGDSLCWVGEPQENHLIIVMLMLQTYFYHGLTMDLSFLPNLSLGEEEHLEKLTEKTCPGESMSPDTRLKVSQLLTKWTKIISKNFTWSEIIQRLGWNDTRS